MQPSFKTKGRGHASRFCPNYLELAINQLTGGKNNCIIGLTNIH